MSGTDTRNSFDNSVWDVGCDRRTLRLRQRRAVRHRNAPHDNGLYGGRRKQPAALLSFAMTGRVEISRDSRLPRRARRCIAKRAQAFDQLINLIIEKAYSALAQRDGA